MALSITVNGGGTFTASMEEGPVTFSAELAAVGPKGDTGATGPAGVVAATAPIVYTAGTQTVSMDTAYFVRSPAVAATDGQILAWDAATSRPDWIANEARTVFMSGTNKTGTTIAKGKAVYVSGATGNHPEITLAQANSELASSRTIGITAEEIANNGTGRVIVAGALENVNTNGFVAGDVLYLSPSTAGGFTTTFPTQPDHGVLLGYVTRSNANTGVIEVVVKNYQELEEMSDVLLTSKANGDFLVYESATSLWKNKSAATLDLLTATTAASTYLTQANAASTYQTQAGMSAYLTTASAASTYLTQSSAASIYQTQSGMSAYLTTSAAASTYAPIASPTFTGTVTIPAGASISGFAPLASPALTGTPTAPTAAAATNTTQIATTAFVQQEVPAASTTAAGKVELATDAEGFAGTSASVAMTPKADLFALVGPQIFRPRADNYGAAAVGGSTVASAISLYINTGAGTSGNYALRRFGDTLTPHSVGQRINRVDWSKPIWIGLRFVQSNLNPLVANCTFRLTFGKTSADNAGDLARRGFGVQGVGGGNFQATGHDGTTLTVGTNGTEAIASTAKDLVIYSDGAGNINVYVDGVSVASCTGGPSSSTTDNSVFQFEVQNTATASSNSIVSACNLCFRL